MTDHIISDRVNGDVTDIEICENSLVDFKIGFEHFCLLWNTKHLMFHRLDLWEPIQHV